MFSRAVHELTHLAVYSSFRIDNITIPQVDHKGSGNTDFQIPQWQPGSLRRKGGEATKVDGEQNVQKYSDSITGIRLRLTFIFWYFVQWLRVLSNCFSYYWTVKFFCRPNVYSLFSVLSSDNFLWVVFYSKTSFCISFVLHFVKWWCVFSDSCLYSCTVYSWMHCSGLNHSFLSCFYSSWSTFFA